MADLVKGFLQGIMNKDADERILPEGQYRDAQNINIFNQEGSSTGTVHNSLGNTRIADMATITGRSLTNAKTIGAVKYESNSLIYWCLSADTFDGVYEYDRSTGITTRVLQSNKINPTTPSKLNFRKEYPITGINYIPGRNGNNYLYFTDNYNPPRRINITRAKSYSVNDIRIESDINVSVKPPIFAPAIYPFLDITDPSSNNMKEKFITFAYRWKNIDGQYSSLSPFSAVAFAPGNYSYDYGIGNNKSMVNKFNSAKIVCDTGDEFVDEIQIILQDTRSPNAKIIETISKSKSGIENNTSTTFLFKNNKTYAPLPIDQVTRLFDNVPLLAKAQDVIGNRLAYGNYLQFRDIKDCYDKSILIDFKLSLLSNNTASLTNPLPTWRSDRDYETGLIYGDDQGRTTTVLTSKDNSLYIPASKSITANTIKLQIDSKPPCWATNYRVVVKQSKGDFYNLFPIVFYKDASYRYFLINTSDIDKIKTGDYIIIKTENYGPTISNKKYKILEVKNKAAGFLSSAPEGIYFKIKVNSPSELDPNASLSVFWNFQNGTDHSNYTNFNQIIGTLQVPVFQAFSFVEIPVHYGDGNPNALVRSSENPNTTNINDYRFTVEAISDTQYRYTKAFNGQGGWITGNISIGTDITLYDGTLNVCSIKFNQPPTTGDIWKINVRGKKGSTQLVKNYFSGTGILTSNVNLLLQSTEIAPGGWAAIECGEQIYAGDLIQITIVIDSFNSSASYSQQPFISSGNYANIEEWFVEDGAYLNFVNPGPNSGFRSVSFRRGKQRPEIIDNTYAWSSIDQIIPSWLTSKDDYPICMIIQGNGIGEYYNGPGQGGNRFGVELKITRSTINILCETVPLDTNLDIYHEVFQTHAIVNNQHTVLWNYDDFESYSGNTKLRQFNKTKPHYFAVGDSIYVESTNNTYMPSGAYSILQVPDQYSVILDFTFPGNGPITPGKVRYNGSIEQDQNGFTPAIIEINKPQSINSEYNAWCFGNGVESDRIYDDWNQTTKQFSVRAYSPFEGYKQVRNESSVCYSGVYSENSSLNRLNEFNLSTANFKHLEKEFGSIQRLDARDTDLLVFQENKISSVLYEKNVLYDAVGGGQVASIPQVLGNQIAFVGEYGISRNPESFDKWGDDRFFVDTRNGVVMKLTGNGLTEISSTGMNDYFRDLLNENPTTEKLGAYDPHNRMYILSSTEQSVIPCKLDLIKHTTEIPSNAVDFRNFLAFSIITEGSWTITAQSAGSGTSWVTGYSTSGNGSQDIYMSASDNMTTSTRSIRFIITYCDGLTQEFKLTQARGRKGKVVVAVFNNDTKNQIKR